MSTPEQRHARGQVRMRVTVDLDTSMDPGFVEQWFHNQLRHQVGSPTWVGRNGGHDKPTAIAIVVEPTENSDAVVASELRNIQVAQGFAASVNFMIEGNDGNGEHHLIRSFD